MRSFCLISALVTFCGMCHAMDYPVITVDTDSGTLDSPLSIDDMNVSVVASEGADAEVVSFASLGRPTAGTLRKRGTGFVMSSPSMTNFLGTVLIEEGALCCEGPGAFGPATNNPAPGTIVISNGASLVVAGRAATMTGYHMELWNPITLEGTGVNGIGAIYNKTVEVTSRETIKGGLTLTGDTLIGSVSNYELADKGGTTSAYFMNGHTLTISGGYGIMVNGAVFEPGHIVVTNKSLFRIQSGFTLQGDSSNTLHVHKASSLACYNGGAFTAPWTLLLEDGAKLQGSGSKSTDQVSTLKRHNWLGPIVLNGQIAVAGNDSLDNEGWSLWGPISGVGGFGITRGYLNLTNDLNDFRGPVAVSASTVGRKATLGLWGRSAWPRTNEHPLAVTNASVYFGKAIEYDLPKILWHNEPAYTNSHMYGKASCLVTPGVVKTGSGALEVPATLVATGRTELAAGTLRLAPPNMTSYSSEPGVWECLTRFGSAPDNETFAAYFTNGTQADTNGVTTALRYMQKTGTATTEPSWGDYQVSRYVGYIWNRSGETQRWSLAMATIKGRLFFDDTLVLKQENTWYWLATNTISVAPGPHKFDIRFYNTTYAAGGAKDAYQIANGLTGAKMKIDDGNGNKIDEPLPERWPKNFGFGIDVQGRSSLYSADYVKPANGTGQLEGGDGMWFTRTDKTLEQSLDDDDFAGTHIFSRFDTLAATYGTTLDLGGGDVYVGALEGFTHATNGTLRVTDKWTLDAAATDGASLSVDDHAKIVFAAGATLDVDDIKLWRRRGETVTILTADSIDGLPAVSPALAAVHAVCAKSQDGKALSLHIPPRGIVINFR